MELPDLHAFPPGHPPSPYDHPLLIVRDGRVGDGYLPPGLQLYAVGWLERPGFPRGKVPGACIEALAAPQLGTLVLIPQPNLSWRACQRWYRRRA